MSDLGMDKQMYFVQFCTFLDGLTTIKKKFLKQKRVEAFFKEWRQRDLNLFPFLRLLLPHLDSTRVGLLHLKENKLAEILIESFALSKDSHDAFILKNWQQSYSTHGIRQSGYRDFAQVAKYAIHDRLPEVHSTESYGKVNGPLTIHDINEKLDALTNSSAAQKVLLFKSIFTRLVKREFYWFLKIILQKSSLAMPENIYLRAVDPSAVEYINVCSDLRILCDAFQDVSGNVPAGGSLNIKTVVLGRPFKPMLAGREDLDTILNIYVGTDFYIEDKIDGERLQIHKKSNGELEFYTRNGRETSRLYSDTFKDTFLKAIRKDVKGIPTSSFIIDGEIVAWDQSTKKILPFGSTPLGRNIGGESLGARPWNYHYNKTKYDNGQRDDLEDNRSNSSIVPCFFVFDIVYINGRNMMECALSERLRLLEQFFDPIEGVLMPISRNLTSSGELLMEKLDEAVQAKREGLVLKKADSIYSPGHRVASIWAKIKADYIKAGEGHLADSLDVLIVGASYGVGIMGETGHLAGVTVAVKKYRPNASNENDPTQVKNESQEEYPSSDVFLTLCKVGSGWSQAELLSLEQICLPLMCPCPDKLNLSKAVYPQDRIKFGEDCKDLPDLIIKNPFTAPVIEIKGFEMVRSPKYTCGWTVRFPKFIRHRPDKSADQISSSQDVAMLQEISSKESIFRSDQNTPSKRKKVSTKKKVFSLAPGYEKVSIPHPEYISGVSQDIHRENHTGRSGEYPFETSDSRMIYLDRSITEDNLVVDSKETVANPLFLKNKVFCILQCDQQTAGIDKHGLANLILQHGGQMISNPTSPNSICLAARSDLLRVKNIIRSKKYNVMSIKWMLDMIKQQHWIPISSNINIEYFWYIKDDIE